MLTGQVAVYKKELEAFKVDANYFEKLACERDRSLDNLKGELKAIEAKLCDLILTA